MSDKPLASAISCHAWNHSGDLLAMSPNSTEVHIYKVPKGEEDWTKWGSPTWTLNEHTGHVSDMDWNHKNELVTCSHDRSAFVWKLDAGKNEWSKEMAILRITRAATSVKWAPSGDKFAVGSASLVMPVCHYEEDNQWWVSKTIKKSKKKNVEPFDSTVLSVAWSPNSKYVITGGADNKCKIFSGYIKGVDAPGDDEMSGVWADQHEFGACLAEFDARGWVESVAWSASGALVAFSTHGSSVSVVNLQNNMAVSEVTYSGLPFTTIVFANEDTIIAAGWDCNPAVFKNSGGSWSFVKYLDDGEKKPSLKKAKSKFDNIRGMFGDAANKGIELGSSSSSQETEINTRHQNSISGMCLFAEKPVVSTAGLDGRVFFWDLAAAGIL